MKGQSKRRRISLMFPNSVFTESRRPHADAILSTRFVALVLGIVESCIALAAHAESPGEHFDRYMARLERKCASMKLAPQETTCEILKLSPRNFSQAKFVSVDGQPEPVPEEWVSTPEGKFAHSIKIPNPLPRGSGYKTGMTSAQYFDHLCRSEAGEFIYRSIEDQAGVYMMRPRQLSTYEPNHLYAMENPYIGTDDALGMTPWRLVRPGRFTYLETPKSLPLRKSNFIDQSVLEQSSPQEGTIFRYSGYDGKSMNTMKQEREGKSLSQYGYIWRGVVRKNDRDHGIAGGETIVLNLLSHEVLAVKRGFARFTFLDDQYGISGLQWRERCPADSVDLGDREVRFLLKVLHPRGVH